MEKKRILIVDDDPSTIKLLEGILTKQGYEVLISLDGIDAMVQVKMHKPDLIILDVMMPDVNGYDVCRNIKFDSPYKAVPIILLTAREQEIDTRVSQMMGITYVHKPFEREAFLNKIQQMIK